MTDKKVTFTDMLEICRELRIDSVTFGYDRYDVYRNVTLTISQDRRHEQYSIDEYVYRKLIEGDYYMRDILHSLLNGMSSFVIKKRLENDTLESESNKTY